MMQCDARAFIVAGARSTGLVTSTFNFDPHLIVGRILELAKSSLRKFLGDHIKQQAENIQLILWKQKVRPSLRKELSPQGTTQFN